MAGSQDQLCQLICATLPIYCTANAIYSDLAVDNTWKDIACEMEGDTEIFYLPSSACFLLLPLAI